MIAMTSHRHEPSDTSLALLGSVSAPDARGAHYCDQAAVSRLRGPGQHRAYDTTVAMEPSNEIRQSGVNPPVIWRNSADNPQYPQTLHAATTLQHVGITQMRPLPLREIQENEGEDAGADLDEHGEDFDAEWNRAQDYNDYLRDIEA